MKTLLFLAVVALATAQTTSVCKMFTDNLGDLYNMNVLANGGEGWSVPGDPAANGGNGNFFRMTFCEGFQQRWIHTNACNNDTNTGLCWAYALGDEKYEGYNLGDFRTASMTTLGSKLEQEEGVRILMTGNPAKIPPVCNPGATPKTEIDVLCANTVAGVAYPVISYDAAKFNKETCTFKFQMFSNAGCSLNRCPVWSSKYGTIDLNPLNKGVPFTIPKDGDRQQLQVMMCGSLQPQQSNCSHTGVSVCEEWEGGGQDANYHVLATAYGWEIQSLDGSEDPNGVVLTAGYGQFSNTFRQLYRVRVIVNCAAELTGAPVFTYTSKENNVITLTTNHASACIEHANSGPGVFIGNHWLSLGSILLIFFFVGGFVYLVIGAAVNYKRGKTGTELIPNRDTWRSLWNLSMEGWSFTFSKITGKGSSNLYDTV